MKINWSTGPTTAQPPSRGGNIKRPEMEFKEVMGRIMSKPEANEASSGMSEASAPLPAPSVVIGSHSADRLDIRRVMGDIQSLLDEVDFYARKLANTSLSAADLTPLVRHLEERVSDIMEYHYRGKLPESLGKIISDLAITVSAEVAKFDRGDYS